MEHLKDCDFQETIKQLQNGSWTSGSGEISGSVDISEECILFSDGWDFFTSIEFIFCPICGVKLK